MSAYEKQADALTRVTAAAALGQRCDGHPSLVTPRQLMTQSGHGGPTLDRQAATPTSGGSISWRKRAGLHTPKYILNPLATAS